MGHVSADDQKEPRSPTLNMVAEEDEGIPYQSAMSDTSIEVAPRKRPSMSDMSIEVAPRNRVSRTSSYGAQTTQHHAPGLCGDVWVCQESGWVLKHQFNMGLEYERPSDETEASRAILHLPSTSLSALQQLRTALDTSKAIDLDRTLRFGETDLSAFHQETLDLAADQGELNPDEQEEALAKLKQRLQTRRRSSKDSSCLTEIQSSRELIMNPEAGTESVDISVCPLKCFDSEQTPVLAMMGLASSIHVDGEGGAELDLKYAAILLCSGASGSLEIACRMARALASTFMDRTFADAVLRSAAAGTKSVLPAFDAYLANVTIVPTVYVPRSISTLDVQDEIYPTECLLSESLADAIKTRIYKSHDIVEMPKEERENFPNRPRSHSRLNMSYLEIHKFQPLVEEWCLTHCLRQGLEVDNVSGTAHPHMPCVSMTVLASVQSLIDLKSVSLDVRMESLDQSVESILTQLRCAGLPLAAMPAVRSSLTLGHGTDQVHSPSNELFNPCDADEPCLIIEIPTKLEPAAGFFGAFLRFQSPLQLPFTTLGSPSKFLFVLVGPSEKESELTELGHALGVLVTDEDLMDGLTTAKDCESFVGAFSARLNDLIVIPGARSVMIQSGASFMSAPKDSQDTPDNPHGAKAWGREKSMRKTSTRLSNRSTASIGSSMSWVETFRSSTFRAENETTWQWMKRKARGVRSIMQKYSLALVFGVLLALVWSNIDEHSHHDFTHSPIFKGAKILGHDASLHFFVNDIFMVFYFGLAIKEIVEAVLPGGSLSPLRRAVNPLMATIGGVVVPVAIYCVCVYFFEMGGVFDNTMCEPIEEKGVMSAPGPEVCEMSALMMGWGVPTSTDISLAWMFALIIFGAGHPVINVLLLLVILDDAIGMLIIAIFYPDPKHPVEPVWLLLILGSMAVAFALRKLKVTKWQAYVFLAGPIAWLGLLLAHVHPALSLAFVVPFMPDKQNRASLEAMIAETQRRKSVQWDNPAEEGHDSDCAYQSEPDSPTATPAQNALRSSPSFRKMRNAVSHVANVLHDGNIAQTNSKRREHKKAVKHVAEILLHLHAAPLHAFEHSLKLPVDLGMFFFGLANAGVQLGQVGGITYSVVIALLVGKTVGITLFSLLAIWLGFLLPPGVSIGDLLAMSALGGIGLTVALFVANEAFVDPGLRGQAKMGAVLSVSAGGVAFAIKFVADKFFSDDDDFEELDELPDTPPTPVADPSGMDGELVDTILQVMWTARKYRARGVSMPMTADAIVKRSGSKATGGRGASKQVQVRDESGDGSPSGRRSSKTNTGYQGAFPAQRSSSKDRPQRQTSCSSNSPIGPSPKPLRQTSCQSTIDEVENKQLREASKQLKIAWQ